MAEIGKRQLVDLAEAKLKDAKLLLQAGSGGNAYYLAGYAVELMLKAILSSQFKADTIPDRTLLREVFVHDLAKLARLAHLEEQLRHRQDADAEFDAYWQIVLQWDEGSRYVERDFAEAQYLIEAIQDEEHGVLSWLRSKL